MEELKFKVSAELKNILGRDLITSDNIAIFELVKNSYDAHASKVEITFEEDRIVIADNGKGMAKDDIINKWLFVAYSAKRDGTEDASYRSKFRRNFAGAKGVGRLSCDRLAQKLVMTTQSQSDTLSNRISLDWGDFEHNQSLEFDEIPVQYDSITNIVEYPEHKPTGTIIELTELNSHWSKQEILDLRKALEKMINPFAETNDFEIEIIAPQFAHADELSKEKVRSFEKDSPVEDESILIDIARLKNGIVNGPIQNSIASVLKLKTTQIESRIADGKIHTRLTDRGVLMYEICEDCKYPELDNASVDLYFLNRAAKYNFSLRMGVNPVGYGNVFLFRNGFRIWPYGEPGDDSWELDKRALQGYNRSLGTRNLFGRVDVETEDVDKFKEVSSRDGGLVMNEPAKQLHSYFSEVHRRLERYVAGVLWGELFLRNDYFKNNEQAIAIREKLKSEDKDSEDIKNALNNIGSRVDFLQLIKSLVNDDNVELVSYNTDLANIVADVSATELINANLIEDMKKVAEDSGSADMKANLDFFEHQLEEMRKAKEEAERKAEEARKAKEEADLKAAEDRKARAEAERRVKEEEAKNKRLEDELSQKKKQNIFLQSIGSLDKDRIIKFHHDIRIQAETVNNSVSTIIKNINSEIFDKEKTRKASERIARANSRIMAIVKYATKANFNTEGDVIEEDILMYIEQYVTNILPTFYPDKTLTCSRNDISKTIKFNPLEVSLLVDNLLSNSLKASANHFGVEIHEKEGKVVISIYDDGKGIQLEDVNSIFEKGVTTTNGSGLGLYNVANYVRNELKGQIVVDESFMSSENGRKGCKLIITF